MNEIYIYPCRTCMKEFKWAVEQPEEGKTCPSCKEEVMSQLIAWGEAQERDEELLHKRMDGWWESLSQEDRERAFFSVVKRLNQYDAVENLSYREVLRKFGFESKRHYYMGINCGFMNLHSCIATRDEMQEMRSALRIQKIKEQQIREAFRIKSTCKWCGYQSMDLKPGSMCPMIDCEGGME